MSLLFKRTAIFIKNMILLNPQIPIPHTLQEKHPSNQRKLIFNPSSFSLQQKALLHQNKMTKKWHFFKCTVHVLESKNRHWEGR